MSLQEWYIYVYVSKMRSHPNGQTCSTSRILDENVWLFSQGFRHLSEYTIWAFSYTFENKQCNCKPSYVCFRIRLFFLWWLLKFRSHFYFIFSIGWIVNFFSSTLGSSLTPFYLLSRQISNRQRWHSSHDYIGSTWKQNFQPQSQGERNR